MFFFYGDYSKDARFSVLVVIVRVWFMGPVVVLRVFDRYFLSFEVFFFHNYDGI